MEVEDARVHAQLVEQTKAIAELASTIHERNLKEASDNLSSVDELRSAIFLQSVVDLALRTPPVDALTIIYDRLRRILFGVLEKHDTFAFKARLENLQNGLTRIAEISSKIQHELTEQIRCNLNDRLDELEKGLDQVRDKAHDVVSKLAAKEALKGASARGESDPNGSPRASGKVRPTGEKPAHGLDEVERALTGGERA
jgi:uncharacterized phage infection (PIP) family protein YhgE